VRAGFALQTQFNWKIASDGILGKGAFSIVSLGLDLDSGQLMAVKRIKVDARVLQEARRGVLSSLQELEKEVSACERAARRRRRLHRTRWRCSCRRFGRWPTPTLSNTSA
jgi:hypothetical protein